MPSRRPSMAPSSGRRSASLPSNADGLSPFAATGAIRAPESTMPRSAVSPRCAWITSLPRLISNQGCVRRPAGRGRTGRGSPFPVDCRAGLFPGGCDWPLYSARFRIAGPPMEGVEMAPEGRQWPQYVCRQGGDPEPLPVTVARPRTARPLDGLVDRERDHGLAATNRGSGPVDRRPYRPPLAMLTRRPIATRIP